MATDLIRYDLLVQDALRGVVRKVLADAARDGLPGDHHFYITFHTPAPGVRLSARMREQYPDEMTIILQHQFWDLSVSEHAFEVGLSFKGIPETLVIPFEALTGFFDPSVPFGLKIEQEKDEAEVSANDAGPGAEPEEAFDKPPTGPRHGRGKSRTDEASVATAADDAPGGEDSTPKVVSIDAFRRKT
jgi:hypothetical protein